MYIVYFKKAVICFDFDVMTTLYKLNQDSIYSTTKKVQNYNDDIHIQWKR